MTNTKRFAIFSSSCQCSILEFFKQSQNQKKIITKKGKRTKALKLALKNIKKKSKKLNNR